MSENSDCEHRHFGELGLESGKRTGLIMCNQCRWLGSTVEGEPEWFSPQMNSVAKAVVFGAVPSIDKAFELLGRYGGTIEARPLADGRTEWRVTIRGESQAVETGPESPFNPREILAVTIISWIDNIVGS